MQTIESFFYTWYKKAAFVLFRYVQRFIYTVSYMPLKLPLCNSIFRIHVNLKHIKYRIVKKYLRDKSFVVFVVYSLLKNAFPQIVCRAIQSYKGDSPSHETFFSECQQGNKIVKVLLKYFVLYCNYLYWVENYFKYWVISCCSVNMHDDSLSVAVAD